MDSVQDRSNVNQVLKSLSDCMLSLLRHVRWCKECLVNCSFTVELDKNSKYVFSTTLASLVGLQTSHCGVLFLNFVSFDIVVSLATKALNRP